MGLALDRSTEDLIPGLTENRHLGPGPDRTKHYPRSAHYLFNGALGHPNAHLHVPAYKLPLLELARREDPQYRVDRRRQLHRVRSRWTADSAEGRDLARSDLALPTDTAPGSARRTPSLERQEAFRDESTTKKRTTSFRRETSFKALNVSGDETTAELYRLGLLYDDEHLRGEGFGFGTLVRDEPAYTLRPAKRPRKLNRGRGFGDAGDEAVFLAPPSVTPRGRRHLLDDAYDQGLALALDLSFAELGRDEAIARFLISPSPSETSDDETTGRRPSGRTTAKGREPRLDYTLDNGNAPAGADFEHSGSTHSFHNLPKDGVDTDLGNVDDDSNDVPDLVPDESHDTKTYDNDDCNDGAETRSDDSTEDPDFELLDRDEDEAPDGGNAQPGGDGTDAWVMLG